MPYFYPLKCVLEELYNILLVTMGNTLAISNMFDSNKKNFLHHYLHFLFEHLIGLLQYFFFSLLLVFIRVQTTRIKLSLILFAIPFHASSLPAPQYLFSLVYLIYQQHSFFHAPVSILVHICIFILL